MGESEARCPHHVDDPREIWRLNCPACWGGELRRVGAARDSEIARLREKRSWCHNNHMQKEKEIERLVKLLDRAYRSWCREGWEEGGETFADVMGDVAWELYDRQGAPMPEPAERLRILECAVDEAQEG